MYKVVKVIIFPKVEHLSFVVLSSNKITLELSFFALDTSCLQTILQKKRQRQKLWVKDYMIPLVITAHISLLTTWSLLAFE